jgi:predicted nucleic acid-binding protein
MTRVALDSNVLVYAELEADSAKGRRAADVIMRAAADAVVPVQALGEFLRVVQSRAPAAYAEAAIQAQIYRAVFLTPPTTEEVLTAAAELALTHRVPFWNGVVCAAAAGAGATVLLSESLPDGQIVGGVRIIDPFAPANEAELAALLDATRRAPPMLSPPEA